MEILEAHLSAKKIKLDEKIDNALDSEVVWANGPQTRVRKYYPLI